MTCSDGAVDGIGITHMTQLTDKPTTADYNNVFTLLTFVDVFGVFCNFVNHTLELIRFF